MKTGRRQEKKERKICTERYFDLKTTESEKRPERKESGLEQRKKEVWKRDKILQEKEKHVKEWSVDETTRESRCNHQFCSEEGGGWSIHEMGNWLIHVLRVKTQAEGGEEQSILCSLLSTTMFPEEENKSSAEDDDGGRRVKLEKNGWLSLWCMRALCLASK